METRIWPKIVLSIMQTEFALFWLVGGGGLILCRVLRWQVLYEGPYYLYGASLRSSVKRGAGWSLPLGFLMIEETAVQNI